GVRARAVGNGDVLAQPERVVLIDPVVIVEVGVCGDRRFALRPWRRVQRPAFRALLTGCSRAARDLALAPIEAGDVTAPAERGPDQTVAVDVDAARTEAPLARLDRVGLERWLIDFGLARLGRVRPELHPDEAARHRSWLACPDRAVLRVRDDPVVEAGDPRVFCRVDGRARLVPRAGDLAVTVCVQDRRAPALRGAFVAALVELLRVQPADDVGVAAQPERVVVAELQVMRAVAGVDEHELPAFRVVVRELAADVVLRD